MSKLFRASGKSLTDNIEAAGQRYKDQKKKSAIELFNETNDFIFNSVKNLK